MNKMNPMEWKKDLPEFKEKTAQFYAGEMKKPDYKGFSGYYGSYAQRDQKSSMLRLRMPAGRLTKEKMKFVVDSIKKYGLEKIHYTTCQTIQLHDLKEKEVCEIMEAALDCGIVTMGGGGDFPRNVMCSPLSGVEKDEYFNVLPWAEQAGEYLMNFIKAEKMPRKLKVCFSNSPKNLTHATFRDLGFAAREDGRFDVYSAGGLGNNPRFGVKVAEAVEPEKILYYIKAMWLTFRAYGNYENRGKARTRYMQEILGSAEEYKKAFLEKLSEVEASGENLHISVEQTEVKKTGNKTAAADCRIIEQKQEGLYAVCWHPVGGMPDVEEFCHLYDVIKDMEEVELRLTPDEASYIINLTGEEAEKVLEATKNGASSLFESSVSCIGAAICQVGVRDSQALLANCVKAVREAGIPDGALPQMHISGCPSSCGTHQIGAMGFRGAAKKINDKMEAAFLLTIHGNEEQGQEKMGEEAGTILEADIPEFLVTLGKAVAESGMDFEEWNKKNPDGVREIAAPYIEKD